MSNIQFYDVERELPAGPVEEWTDIQVEEIYRHKEYIVQCILAYHAISQGARSFSIYEDANIDVPHMRKDINESLEIHRKTWKSIARIVP